jgi:RNA polymerase sigma-70 factor, ECF subfamily
MTRCEVAGVRFAPSHSVWSRHSSRRKQIAFHCSTLSQSPWGEGALLHGKGPLYFGIGSPPRSAPKYRTPATSFVFLSPPWFRTNASATLVNKTDLDACRVFPMQAFGVRGPPACAVGIPSSGDQRPSCALTVCVNAARRADRYEGIADTIVQLFRPDASGLIASSQAFQSGMRNERFSERRREAMNVQEAAPIAERREDTHLRTPEAASIDEHLLVAEAKSGGSSAFGQLYERHRLRILRTAFRILRNRQDAEDAVQRSFQRAFTNFRRFREDSTFSTWLTRIAINEALMLLRQRRKPSLSQMQNDDVNDTSALDIADERATPEQALAEDELRSLVHQAISRHRSSLQSAALLRELQGLTSAETARCLGLTVSVVKARRLHARRHLRRHLKQNWLYSRCVRPARPNVASGLQDLYQSTLSGYGPG